MDFKKYLKIELISTFMNFKTMFNKFKIYHSDCPLLPTMQEKINQLKNIIVHIVNDSTIADEKMRDLFKRLMKVMWVMDDYMTNYIAKKSNGKMVKHEPVYGQKPEPTEYNSKSEPKENEVTL